MVKFFELKCTLLGYDIITSEKGKFVKLYLVNHREVHDNQYGDTVFEVFENFDDWKDFLRDDRAIKGVKFGLEGFYKDYKFRPVRILGFEEKK